MAARNQTGNVINFPNPVADPRPRRVWGRIETDDPPCGIYDYAALRAMADRLLTTREKRFPALVTAGKLDAAEAQAELTTFRMIAADWCWICTGEGTPAPIGSIELRRAALDRSLATIADIAREEGRFSDELAAQADAVIAMRWHLEPGSRTHALAQLTHQIPADSAPSQTSARQEASHAV